jgi:hypothetical protein
MTKSANSRAEVVHWTLASGTFGSIAMLHIALCGRDSWHVYNDYHALPNVCPEWRMQVVIGWGWLY